MLFRSDSFLIVTNNPTHSTAKTATPIPTGIMIVMHVAQQNQVVGLIRATVFALNEVVHPQLRGRVDLTIQGITVMITGQQIILNCLIAVHFSLRVFPRLDVGIGKFLVVEGTNLDDQLTDRQEPVQALNLANRKLSS